MPLNSAVNADILDQNFRQALEASWDIETCWPGCRDRWTPENPAWGQCLVSTLAAWAYRGGHDNIVAGLTFVPGNAQGIWHFRLKTNEKKDVDLTWQQFEAGSFFKPLQPEDDLYATVNRGSFLQDPSLLTRLNLLLGRMKDHGCDAGMTAREIVDRMEIRHAHTLFVRNPATRPVP